ncbi:ECF transporter S component [Metamycoplasma neophronis]|uniref:ECF transporter S component n=1 Tax=Metamycoplasma neophronis TaxID=872983 RepID=A0ABY2Z0R9_9BACT|nr:ECF transporter S component [Metamycoplasma neophronis]TPR53872.1 ECF transporter S component [Metamycoplasma neophronis]
MIAFFQNVRRKIKVKAHRLTVFEIAMFGILLALYFIAATLEKFVFVGAFNIGITYAIFIVFGLAIGPWKGAILGILCDTLNQVIYGISTWMIEYAIIPAIIAFMSGWFVRFMFLKQKTTWIFGYILLSLLTITFVLILVFNAHQLPVNEVSVKRTKLLTLNFVLGVGITGITFIWITTLVLTIINISTRDFKKKMNATLLFSILLTVFVILILSRWLWGPFAYINYHNRFRSGHWEYKKYYPIFMIPIMFKSLLEIPIYTALIFAVFPLLAIIRRKINFYSNKIHTY